MSRRQDERREAFQRYKRDVQERGKPFFPYAMFHDTVMSLVFLSVIVVLGAVRYFTSGEDRHDMGWLGPPYTEESDTGLTNFVRRPEW